MAKLFVSILITSNCKKNQYLNHRSIYLDRSHLIVKCRKANVTGAKINKTFHTAHSFASSADKNKERYTNLSDYFVCLSFLFNKPLEFHWIRQWKLKFKFRPAKHCPTRPFCNKQSCLYLAWQCAHFDNKNSYGLLTSPNFFLGGKVIIERGITTNLLWLGFFCLRKCNQGHVLVQSYSIAKIKQKLFLGQFLFRNSK